MPSPPERAPAAGQEFEISFSVAGLQSSPPWPSVGGSLAAHTLFVAFVWSATPSIAIESFPEPTFDDVFASSNRTLFWNPPQKELPSTAPLKQPRASNKPTADRPRFKLPQRISADDPKPDSKLQMIRAEAPDVRIEQDLPLPNMLELKGQKLKAPKLAPSRFEPKSVVPVAPDQRAIDRLEAPRVAEASPPPAPKFDQTPRLRFQAEAAKRAEPRRETIEADAAPDLNATSQAEQLPVELQPALRLRFQGEQAEMQAPEEVAVAKVVGDGAPRLADSGAPAPGLALSELQNTARLRYQSGSGGGQDNQAPAAQAAGAAVPAPEIVEQSAATNRSASLTDTQQPQVRYRAWDGSGAADGKARPGTDQALAALSDGDAPPELSASGGSAEKASELLAELNRPEVPTGPQGGTGGDRDLVVVGVNPSSNPPSALPRGRRRGEFSAGPDGGPGGGRVGVEADQEARLRVPNLSVSGPRTSSAASSASGIVGGSSPTAIPPKQPRPRGAGPGGLSAELARLTRRGNVADLSSLPPPDLKIEYHEKALDPEHPFVGRPVYTVAVNTPNVTSYQGSWVIQFAELETEEEATDKEEGESGSPEAKLYPPSPSYKVDPKYSASAMKEEVEGEVVLHAIIGVDGLVSRVQLIEGVDGRLDADARTALEKWRFHPAHKAGKPVAIEAFVRIPFKLDPNIKMRY